MPTTLVVSGLRRSILDRRRSATSRPRIEAVERIQHLRFGFVEIVPGLLEERANVVEVEIPFNPSNRAFSL